MTSWMRARRKCSETNRRREIQGADMNLDYLRDLKNRVPFKAFTIQMSDGHQFRIDDPESLVIHPEWTVDAIVLQPKGRFSFLYIKNVTSVTGEGHLPRLRSRRRKGSNGS